MMNPIKEEYSYRLIIFVLVDLILFGMLITRVYNLQIEQFPSLSSEAVQNMYRQYEIKAPRGIIYDRYHRPIVFNQMNYDVSILPYEFEENTENWQAISSILNTSVDVLKKRKQNNLINSYTPTKIASSIDFLTLSKIEEHLTDIPGIILQSKPVRQIDPNATAAHIIGYTNEINRRNVENYKSLGYKSGDMIGIKGIEKVYESILKGVKGKRYVRVNALGKDFGEDFNKTEQPISGNDLFLTIDWELQSYVESLFDTTLGCAITINYLNGEIISFVSKPDYNPEIFSGVLTQEVWQSISSDTLKPMFNRLVQAQYPPGSVYKMITAVAALEENIIQSDTKFTCKGVYRLGKRPFRCWKGGGHGEVDLIEALEGSCNIYFYNVIQKLGIEKWYKYGKMFGFGELTNIDVPDEATGNLPDRNYLNKTYGRSGWGTGNLLNLSIGQGETLVTPVQLAQYITIIANKGTKKKLHLLKAYYDKKLDKLITPEYSESQLTSISDHTWDIIHEGMRRVIQGQHGTAKKVNLPNLNIHGKTGTAQNPHGDNHAWFIGFSKKPQFPFAQVVLVEFGGSGSGAAAPIAKNIFKYYEEILQF